jgi:YD repeat-containing protein
VRRAFWREGVALLAKSDIGELELASDESEREVVEKRDGGVPELLREALIGVGATRSPLLEQSAHAREIRGEVVRLSGHGENLHGKNPGLEGIAPTPQPARTATEAPVTISSIAPAGTQYTYDDLNFQTDAWLRATEQAPAIHLDQVARDLVGNAVSQTDRFGHTVAFKYDGLDRQTRRARAWGQACE